MIYSESVKKACLISFEAHKNQLDKGGYPYPYHPFYIATKMTSEDAVCVALLHDVMEDYPKQYNEEYFRQAGFHENVLNALKLLTHDPEIPYLEYIQKIKTDPIAKEVKIEDLKHNMDITRLDGIVPPKMELYQQALALLLKD